MEERYGHPKLNENCIACKDVSFEGHEAREPTLKEKRQQERYEGQHNFFRGRGYKSKNNYKKRKIR